MHSGAKYRVSVLQMEPPLTACGFLTDRVTPSAAAEQRLKNVLRSYMAVTALCALRTHTVNLKVHVLVQAGPSVLIKGRESIRFQSSFLGNMFIGLIKVGLFIKSEHRGRSKLVKEKVDDMRTSSQLRRRYLICAAVAKSRYVFIQSNYMQGRGG